jgi:2-amino-4-hydroxy-6-hydroxymethyldihydropteridine diphosphokinase
MAAEIHLSGISPSQMLARLLRIEYLLGRKDKNLHKPRTVDLDLLLFGDLQMETPFLTLPHPRMHLRRFVLAPLAEIAPHAVHPVTGKISCSFKRIQRSGCSQTLESERQKTLLKTTR